MVNPPTKEKCEEETVKKHDGEHQITHQGLKRRLKVVNKILNSMVNVTSVAIEGALYAFPKVKLSRNAVRAAMKVGL